MTYLAVDLGGGSGRVIAGTLRDGRLTMDHIHRFDNYQVTIHGHVYWDFPYLLHQVKLGLRKAAALGLDVQGIGIDTWGVDFGLIDRHGDLIGNPVCYRDSRTEGVPDKVFARLDRAAHYRRNGTQVMAINTLFQLMSLKLADSPQLAAAHKMLFTPDLMAYCLTGEIGAEYTIASTSEMLNAETRDWDYDTLRQLDLPVHLLPPVSQPGTVRGQLTPEVQAETGLGPVDVIAVGSHDTASAVAAVPALPDESPVAFLSSGTWSLLGVELPEPLLTEQARRGNFTNEGGVGGRITFLQNITGLWLLQRLMGEWRSEGRAVDYAPLLASAEEADDAPRIDVDDPRFHNPPSMAGAIRAYVAEHQGEAVARPLYAEGLEGQAALTRCVLQSLADKYAAAVASLNALLPTPIAKLHIIGGGSQNGLLNRLTEQALGIPVVAGPVEATAMGNILTQAMAKGELASLEELRAVVRASL